MYSNASHDIGLNCIALNKIAGEKNIIPPPPIVQIYLGGIIDRINDPSKQELFSEFVVQSSEELINIVLKHQLGNQPNAVPFLVAQNSGDFFLNYNAQLKSGRDSQFPADCYSVAQYHAAKMGRNSESEVLGLMALNTSDYLSLLALYYQTLREDPDFSITDEDFIAFKKQLGEERENKIIKPSKIKQKSSERLLI